MKDVILIAMIFAVVTTICLLAAVLVLAREPSAKAPRSGRSLSSTSSKRLSRTQSKPEGRARDA